MSPGPAPTLPSEIADLLMEVALGLQKAAVYPEGHPVLEGIASDLEAQMAAVLATRPSITISVAPHQVLVEGRATDPNQPVLREFAGLLHRHHLGAVVLTAGVSAREVAHLLPLLATDPARLPMPVGLEGPEVLAQWTAIRLIPAAPVAGAALGEEVEDGDDAVGAGSHRAAALWLGLARAALPRDVARTLVDADVEGAQPAAVAAAIEAHGGDVAYDESVRGYLAQLLAALRTDRGPEVAALRRRVGGLLLTLGDAPLRRILARGSDVRARRQLVDDAAGGVRATAVVRLLAAVAAVGGEPLSDALLGVLGALARQAETPGVALRALADAALREQVHRVLRAWPRLEEVERGHRTTLDGLRRRSRVFRATDQGATVSPERLVAIAIATETTTASLWRQVEAMARADDPTPLLDLLDEAPAGAVRDMLWAHVATTVRLREWVARDPMPEGAVARLVARLDVAAITPLLDALELQDDARRGPLIAWLASIGPAVVPALLPRLVGADAAMVRRVLALFVAHPTWPAAPDPVPYSLHPDPLVRREALRLLARDPETHALALARAQVDPDAAVRAAVTAEAGGA